MKDLKAADIASIQVREPQETLTLERKDAGWTIAERAAFPADLERVREFARRYNVIVVLKGAYSTIASPDGNVYFNPTGNPGMATGGSGDVLTGILTGVLAQGYTPLEAAIMGVYIHGRAGDIAVVDKGTEGLIASDLVEYLPQVFR